MTLNLYRIQIYLLIASCLGFAMGKFFAYNWPNMLSSATLLYISSFLFFVFHLIVRKKAKADDKIKLGVYAILLLCFLLYGLAPWI